MKHLDLFSGIGGFALAAQWAGFKTIAFSEIEPYACKILKERWPGVPNLGDIRTAKGIPCDLLTGGFPCQPFSVAGQRRGKEDDRHIWPQMRRIIDEARPTWVLGENVAGIIGMELDNVLSDLENIGYACWPLVVPAVAVDARHRRDRVWIMAYSRERERHNGADIRSTGRDNSERGSETTSDHQKRDKCEHGVGENGSSISYAGCLRNGAIQYQPFTRLRSASHAGEICEVVSDTNAGRCEQRDQGERGFSEPNSGSDVSYAEGEQARRIFERGISTDSGDGCHGRTEAATWLPEPGMGRVAHGIPNRSHRLKGLGNGIVPQVAFQILKRIALIEARGV